MACNHFSNVKISQLRKVLSKMTFGKCDNCKEQASWLCLACFVQGCNRYQSGHAEKHAVSKKHPIAIAIDSSDVWCYPCDESLSTLADTFESESKKTKALEMIEDTKGCLSKHRSKTDKKSKNNFKNAEVDGEKPSQEKKSEKREETKEVCTVRGLSNLGNTCFFNSALQCLNALTFLTDFYTADTELAGINATFGNTIREMRTNRGTVNPRLLHSSITKRFVQFRGFGQQDAHELLRSLLDALSTEFIKFHDNPNNIIEQTFSNRLLSTVRCLKCNTVSRTFDPILDLSLEIPTRRKNLQEMNDD